MKLLRHHYIWKSYQGKQCQAVTAQRWKFKSVLPLPCAPNYINFNSKLHTWCYISALRWRKPNLWGPICCCPLTDQIWNKLCNDRPPLSLSSHAEHHAAIACASCMRGLFTAAGADREKCPGLRVYTHTSHQSAAGADAATSCTSVIGLIHSGKNRR